jgi:hypothetical protein
MTLSGANVNVTNTHNGGVTFFNGGTGVGAAGGGLLFLPGSATTGNFAGGFLTFQSGDGHGTGAGGDITFQAGGGSLSLGTGNGGGVFINAGNGGSTSGNGGGFSLSAGFPLNGDGGLVGLYASDGAGVGNHNGGNVDMYAGVGTGTGTRGYVTFNTFSANYGVATGAGAVTRGAAVGPAAIATAIWIPVLIDGTLTYIEGFR